MHQSSAKSWLANLAPAKEAPFSRKRPRLALPCPTPSPWSILGCSDIHMNMYAYIRVHKYMYISVYICAYMCIYIALSCPAPCPWSILGCSDIHMYMCACIYTCTDIYVHICVSNYMHMHIYNAPRLAAARPRLTQETSIKERRPAKEAHIQQFLGF